MYHIPVLLQESVDNLITDPDGIYIDATFGGGGHSREILKRLKNGKLFSFDQDEDSNRNVIDDERCMLINANFKYIKNFMRYFDAIPVSGILADLGISSYQIDAKGKGFSIRHEDALDLRMDKRKSKKGNDVLNEYSEYELARIFKNYGEIKNSGRLASEICQARKEKTFQTTSQLVDAAKKLARRGRENKYLAQVFQALRIEVNDELDNLKELLIKGTEILQNRGRFVVIAYHSLEDRLVKNFFRSGNIEGRLDKDFFGNVSSPLKPVDHKLITPGEKEIRENPRSRSARMRIAEKTEHGHHGK
ncbi:MAG: 16S rRNA (cytosine(1402)-N(4))-methyltransferase RsmH [Bacteroidales bacterium]